MSTLLFVSGASRGLGRSLAVSFAKSAALMDTPMHAILMARNKDGLVDTEEHMKAVRVGSSTQVSNYSVDLGNLETLESEINPILEQHHDIPNVGRTILVNCAGTTGYIGQVPSSLKEIQQAMDLNFSSKAWLSARFAEEFTSPTIVNISSMCAVKPTPTMGLYSSSSAARDMFHTVLAMDCPNARILNYAPGPTDTDMQAMLRDHDTLDPTVQSHCTNAADSGVLVDPDVTSAELVRLVLEDTFESGQRVEFVDQSAYKF